MLSFLAENWGTILVAVIVLAIVFLAVFSMYRKHKKGESSCGCGCSKCPSSGICHKK